MPTNEPKEKRTEGPFSDQEITAAIHAALVLLSGQGQSAIDAAESDGMTIILRGQKFNVRVANIPTLIAGLLQDA